jgi:hypothetical protein
MPRESAAAVTATGAGLTPLLAISPSLPTARITATVETRHHDDVLGVDAIEDRVGETPKADPTKITPEDRVGHRLLKHPLHRRSNLGGRGFNVGIRVR